MNEKHITDERWHDLLMSGAILSPEEEAHIEQCPRCLAFFEQQAAAGAILPTRTIADEVTIDRIAARSFPYLTAGKNPSFGWLLSPLRIAVGVTTVVVLFFMIYLFTPTTASNEKRGFTENRLPSQANENTSLLGTTPRTFAAGTVILHARARLTIQKDAEIAAESAEKIRLAKGTIEISVEKGDDFSITVADRYLVRVLGTRFTLDSDGTTLAVTVTEGLVEVIDNRTNRSASLSAGMTQIFGKEKPRAAAEAGTSKSPLAVPVEKQLVPGEEQPSFLQQGRAALKSGNEADAMKWFEKELSEGTEKDKALFEIVRLYERQRRFHDILTILTSHEEILGGDSVYREELFIKACKAEVHQQVGTLPSCRKYLQFFPEGYKKNEIRTILEESDER